MSIPKYKPGQIIIVFGKKYRIRRVPRFGIHACPYCHIYQNPSINGLKTCYKYCYAANDVFKKILPQNCVLCPLQISTRNIELVMVMAFASAPPMQNLLIQQKALCSLTITRFLCIGEKMAAMAQSQKTVKKPI